MARFSFLLLAAACGLPLAASAGDDDTISTDRPDFVESSQVVGKGRLQLETSLQWERDRAGGVTARALTTPTLLRIGVADALELRVETDGRTIEHAGDPASGAHTVSAGWADLSAGVKWHIADQDGMRPSVGMIAEVALPTGSAALRGSGFRPSIELPVEWDLGHDWSLGVMPGVVRDSDVTYGVFAASVGKAFSERLHGFAEVAAPQIGHGTQAIVDTGVAWLVNRDCQIDAMVVHGVNRQTPGLSLAFGVSVRR